jgi:hypothetical protein
MIERRRWFNATWIAWRSARALPGDGALVAGWWVKGPRQGAVDLHHAASAVPTQPTAIHHGGNISAIKQQIEQQEDQISHMLGKNPVTNSGNEALRV